MQLIEWEEFTFVVNGRTLKSNVAEAVIMSPSVFESLMIDRTIREFRIDDDAVDIDTLTLLQRLISGEKVEITKILRNSLVSLCQHLENNQLAKMIFSLHVNESTNPLFSFNELDSIGDTVIASEFYSYPVADLRLFRPEILDVFLSSENLVIESEDSLFTTILELGSDYFGLLRYVHIEFLSESGRDRFMNGIDFCWITEDVWKNLLLAFNGHIDDDLKRKRFKDKRTGS
jgi:hypothetical protein